MHLTICGYVAFQPRRARKEKGKGSNVRRVKETSDDRGVLSPRFLGPCHSHAVNLDHIGADRKQEPPGNAPSKTRSKTSPAPHVVARPVHYDSVLSPFGFATRKQAYDPVGG